MLDWNASEAGRLDTLPYSVTYRDIQRKHWREAQQPTSYPTRFTLV